MLPASLLRHMGRTAPPLSQSHPAEWHTHMYAHTHTPHTHTHAHTHTHTHSTMLPWEKEATQKVEQSPAAANYDSRPRWLKTPDTTQKVCIFCVVVCVTVMVVSVPHH